MCIMEIHPHAHSTTMAQAMAHNLSTVDRDLDMFLEVLKARGDTDALKIVQHGQEAVHKAYAIFLEMFGEEVAKKASDPDGHIHTGTGRPMAVVLNAATRAARRDETR